MTSALEEGVRLGTQLALTAVKSGGLLACIIHGISYSDAQLRTISGRTRASLVDILPVCLVARYSVRPELAHT